MKKNIEATLDRGDQLDEMEAKADRLNSQAQTFKKKTGQAKRAYCQFVSPRTPPMSSLIVCVMANRLAIMA